MIQSQPGQIVLETLSWKKPFKKKRAGGVARGVDPEFKSQYRKKKKILHAKLLHMSSILRLLITVASLLFKKGFLIYSSVPPGHPGRMTESKSHFGESTRHKHYF
jgi:hypothetical protein